MIHAGDYLILIVPRSETALAAGLDLGIWPTMLSEISEWPWTLFNPSFEDLQVAYNEC